MNAFLKDFIRRRDSDDVITNPKNTVSYAPGPTASMGLPKPEGGIEFLIESKASAKEVHKFIRGEVSKYNDSQPALRAEIKRRWKGEPMKG
jgi:hypothetical protein